METAEERHAAAARIREAESVRDALRAALTAAGVKLPTFRIDQASCAREKPYPLIELGRCDVATARALAEALRGTR
ncbi:hypothetical protein [Streptomyces boluensis]|uniref:Uncharacterized protein n=1 Tax=Streptomyces boluensis TaxID=1775135 RepID=A0A964UR09_9ACTN|nr:hypothetical protein [Streptomyces boluensis]NBE52850.1 hypothetical protein [Streptomyces boluensis]